MSRVHIVLACSLFVFGCSGGHDDGLGTSLDRRDADVEASVDNAFAERDGSLVGPGDTFDAAPARCGDGRLDPGEACDEGARNGRAEPGACRADCTIPRCGDQITDPGEGCDTGSLLSDVVSDACRFGCRAPSCGDRVVDQGEQCDEGGNASDTLPGKCRTNCKYAGCGDGVLDPGEACDTGPALSDTVPGACRTNCSMPRCGDGVVDLGEACDTGTALSDFEPNACRLACTRASCGDGVVDDGESCDTGLVSSSMLPDVCRASCVAPRCGDGVLDRGEACDDGNGSDADGCRNDCSSPSCGDGVLDLGEVCDDGNRISADGCQATCLLPVCGDGVVDMPSETCDDNNSFDNDGCRANCQIGCTNREGCSDKVYCNGTEECVAGLCKPGTVPVLDDMVACTMDRCDEASDSVLHEGTNSLCTPSASACTGGLLTSYASMCVPNKGCQEIPRMQACADQPSTCTPGSGLDVLLTTFAPACAGSACGAPAATMTPCVAPAPTCDPLTRVGVVTRATCDAKAERCGTELAERNDCAALDMRSCNAGNSSHRVVSGQCTPMGTCTSELTESACEVRAPSCADGRRTSYEPVCDVQTGCGAPRALPGETCPAAAASCEGGTHTRYQPACADASSCSPAGDAVRTTCAGADPSCVDGTVTTYQPSCNPATGCAAPASSGVMRCPVAAPSCAPSPDGFVHTRFAASCANGTACAADGTPTTSNCLGAPPACEQGVLTRFAASCDPANGCGRPVPTERTPCTASAPSCTPSPEGFIHLRYTPACADEGSCASEGSATMSVCQGNGQQCTDGFVTRTQASCDPATGCGQPVTVDRTACPAAAPSCVPSGNGFLHTVHLPACDGPGDCAAEGLALQEFCATPASMCVDGKLTAVAATCDPVAGCGVLTSAPLPCPAPASTCEPVPEGFRYTRFAPACLDGVSCVPGGAPRTESCTAAGATCVNGALTTASPTCDVNGGCGVTTTPPVTCPALPNSCTPVAGGFVYTRHEPACLDGRSCIDGGATVTFNCNATGPVCENGVLGGTSPTCDPVAGCGVVQQPPLPCPVPAATCGTDAAGRPTHTTYSAGCADGVSCAAGGIPKVTVCEAPAPVCRDGVYTSYVPTCSPEGGCAFEPVNETCPTMPAACVYELDGAYVDHYAASGGCNPEGTACGSAAAPVAQRCTKPGPSCEAGTQHAYALTCTAGVGCGVVDNSTACVAKPAECVDNEGTNYRRYAAGCDGPACASGAVYTDTLCPGGATVCDTQDNQVGTKTTVGTCDAATGCGTGAGAFTPCTVTGAAASCNGSNRVTTIPTCEGGVCGTATVETACPGEVTVSCDGATRVISTPNCTGEGVCGVAQTREPCAGGGAVTCDGSARVTTVATCTGAGICGVTNGPREECPKAADSCDGDTAIVGGAICVGAGVCQPTSESTVCSGNMEPVCSNGDVYSRKQTCVSPGKCGPGELTLYSDCTNAPEISCDGLLEITTSSACKEGTFDCLSDTTQRTCPAPTDAPSCSGDSVVTPIASCTKGIGCGLTKNVDACPTGQTCEGGKCVTKDLCAGVKCDPPQCLIETEILQTWSCNPRNGECVASEKNCADGGKADGHACGDQQCCDTLGVCSEKGCTTIESAPFTCGNGGEGGFNLP